MMNLAYMQRILEECENADHPYFLDGTHLNEKGLEAAAVKVARHADLPRATCIISDSCLMSRDKKWCKISMLKFTLARWWPPY